MEVIGSDLGMTVSFPLEPTMIFGAHHVAKTNSSSLVMGSRVATINGSKWGSHLYFKSSIQFTTS
jgi:hypothetical protein